MRIVIALVLAAFAFAIFGCAGMGGQAQAQAELVAQPGDLVAVDYVGWLDDGTAFDTNIHEEAVKAGLPLRDEYAPLRFTIGRGEMIQGFEKVVVGMKVGEGRQAHIAPEEAYGPVDEDLIVRVPESMINAEEVEIGSQLVTNDGQVGTVLGVENGEVIVDFNHPLAGQVLNFKIYMRNITKPSG